MDEARTMMSAAAERLRGVPTSCAGVVEEARSKGYAETIRRPPPLAPDLASDNRQARQAARAHHRPERFIQGFAADVVKKAIIGLTRHCGTVAARSAFCCRSTTSSIVEVAPESGRRGETSPECTAQPVSGDPSRRGAWAPGPHGRRRRADPPQQPAARPACRGPRAPDPCSRTAPSPWWEEAGGQCADEARSYDTPSTSPPDPPTPHRATPTRLGDRRP
ncbi:hypothetical protein QJS66_02600 [Kocuria rhizophila]|nr:hypothetical protein QJS66_02600 [Kocuria rhizophila]